MRIDFQVWRTHVFCFLCITGESMSFVLLLADAWWPIRSPEEADEEREEEPRKLEDVEEEREPGVLAEELPLVASGEESRAAALMGE